MDIDSVRHVLEEKIFEVLDPDIGKARTPPNPGWRTGLAWTYADDLDADSLDLVELVMAIEEAFADQGVTIPEEDLANIRTIEQTLDLLLRKLGLA